MAARYAKIAGGNWSSANTWSATSPAGVDNAGAPTATDDVLIQLASGQVTFDANSTCKTLDFTTYTGTFTHNAFELKVAGNLTFVSGMTYTVNASATIVLAAAGATLLTGGLLMPTINSDNTCTLGDNLSFMANKNISFGSFNTINLNGKTISGNSSINRVLIKGRTFGTAITISGTGSFANCDFQDITLSTPKDMSAQTDIGDANGNTGITFPAGVTQTWSGTSGGNWSANAWTTRVPLPQDNVVISSAFSGSPTIATDMPRLGKNLDFTGSTNTFTFNPINCSLFGSLTLTSGMTLSGAGNFIFAGRSSFTITSAGKQFGCQILVQCPSGTYTLNDAFSTSQNFLLNNGTFDSNGFSATCLAFSSVSGTATRALTMGTSIWTLSSTAATTVWDQSTTTGLTFSGSSSTILINATSANTRIFAGGGLTHGALTYTVAGSTGQLSITGANSFSAINFSDASNARSLKFTAGTTTTIRNASGFNVRGTSGKLMTVNSLTAATHTLSSTGLQSCDYLSLTNSVATGGGAWYAGANSTNVSGNTGWIFTAAPAISATTGSAQHIQNLQNLQRF